MTEFRFIRKNPNKIINQFNTICFNRKVCQGGTEDTDGRREWRKNTRGT